MRPFHVLATGRQRFGARLVGIVGTASATYRIDHVTDGDTVVLVNGKRARLVQIDTPQVYLGVECYGRDGPPADQPMCSSDV
jgi:endonuclease YncB( thermonuclease family)